MICILVTLLLLQLVPAASAALPDPSDQTYAPSLALQEALDLISTLAIDQQEYSNLVDAAIRGAVSATGDKYSRYLPPSEYVSFAADVEGGYYGIGVTVEQGIITNVRPGGPAEKAGLRVGDTLISVDGRPVKGMPLPDLRDALRGEDGTTVTVVVERGGIEMTFAITRAWIKLDTVEHRIIGGYEYGMGYNIGYLKITEFSSTTAADVQAAIQHFLDANAVDQIIDLRDNPGGLIGAAAEVADQFIDGQKPITHLYGRAVQGGTITATPGGKRGKIVVLVNRNTASAAEILAAALQESAGATIVGERTFGKGRFQYLLPLSNGGAVSVTVGMFLTPNGNAIDGKGVGPNMTVVDPRFRELPETPLNPRRTLQRGTVGLDVLGLQEQLRFLGYDVGEPDGVYTAKTASAFKSFERDAGLKADGVATVDDQMAALKACPKPPTTDPIFTAGLKVITGR